MPTDTPILAAGIAAAPVDYTVPNAQELVLLSVNADFDGSATASSYVPVVEILSDAGVVIARCPASQFVSAAGSAEVTWAPFLRAGTVNTFTTIGSGPSPTPVTTPLAVPLAIRAVQPDVANFGAGTAHLGHRVLISQTGFLRDLSLYVGTLVAGTQAEVAVLDTNTPTRTILYKSGYVNLTSAQAWNKIGDPGLLVTAGQHLDFSVALSNTSTVLWIGGLQNSVLNASSAQLPAAFLPVSGGAPPKLVWADTTSPRPYGATTTVAEASLADQLGCPLVLGRISDT